jgi:hypothetical protein
LLDDSEDRRQPQTGPLSPFLGGKKRLENSALRFSIQADPGVCHREHHVRPRRYVVVSVGIVLVELDIGGLDSELSTLGHGVARVQGKIHDDLFDLAGVGPDVPKTISGQRGELHVRTE